METRAGLLIYPGNAPPDVVTQKLQLPPTDARTAGEERIHRSTGVKRIAPKNMWELSSDKLVQSLDLRRHLDWLLAQLLPRASALLELQEMPGLRMGVNCAWYSKLGHGGPTLWPEQMQQMAELNLECSFDLYFLPDEDE